MSHEELVAGYVEGRITRRMFVRRMVMGGLSLSAAVGFADVLSPGAATAGERRRDERDDKRREHHRHHRDRGRGAERDDD